MIYHLNCGRCQSESFQYYLDRLKLFATMLLVVVFCNVFSCAFKASFSRFVGKTKSADSRWTSFRPDRNSFLFRNDRIRKWPTIVAFCIALDVNFKLPRVQQLLGWHSMTGKKTFFFFENTIADDLLCKENWERKKLDEPKWLNACWKRKCWLLLDGSKLIKECVDMHHKRVASKIDRGERFFFKWI